MYSETYKSGKRTFIYILLAFIAGFCLLSVPNWIGLEQFVWIYELAVLLATVFFVYHILRISSYTYIYIINEDVLAVKLKVGIKETVLCAMKIEDISLVSCNIPRKDLRKKHGVKSIFSCNGELFSPNGTDIVFFNRDTSLVSALIFKPSEKFTEILQSKAIDKFVQM